MKPSHLAQLALIATFVCAAGATGTVAQQLEQPGCALGVARVAAERTMAVYDAPGGGRIGFLAPGSRYFVAESRSPRLSARDVWHMLVAPGGAHVGWVRSGEGLSVAEAPCPRALPPIEFPLELLYRGPNR